MFYDSQIANNVMHTAINEFGAVVLPVHDSFICIMEFEKKLRQLMEEEYVTVMKSEVPAGIDMKNSGYYMTKDEIAKEELYKDEYGELDYPEIKPDPKQKLRRKALEK
jgi:hypothetical protein